MGETLSKVELLEVFHMEHVDRLWGTNTPGYIVTLATAGKNGETLYLNDSAFAKQNLAGIERSNRGDVIRLTAICDADGKLLDIADFMALYRGVDRD